MPQNVSCAPNLKYLAWRIFSGFSQAEVAALVEYVVLMAAGGSPALEVAPTAAFEFWFKGSRALRSNR